MRLPIPNEPAQCAACGHKARMGENGEDVCPLCDAQLIPLVAVPSAPDGARSPRGDAAQRRRFRVACRLLRMAGKLNKPKHDADIGVAYPGQRDSESAIDWMVRIGLAPSPCVAAEMLIVGNGMYESIQFALDNTDES